MHKRWIVKLSWWVPILIILFFTSCSMLPYEVQRELDKTLQQEKEHVIATAEAEARKLQEQAQDVGKKALDQALQSIKVWLGLAAPYGVGQYLGHNNITAKVDIENTFRKAYQTAGGGRVIGQPEGSVQLTDGLLSQSFSGGTQKKSQIMMRDGETEAFVLPGSWLDMYLALGGPVKAGYPISDPVKWNIIPSWQFWTRYGRGERQLFQINGAPYALTKRSTSDAILVTPPFIWDYYTENSNEVTLGYPLSSYPLDDRQWLDNNHLSEETKDLLQKWQESPFRVQIFENGSILFHPDHSQKEVIKSKLLFGVGNLTTARFMGNVRDILLNEYENRGGMYQNDQCFYQVLQNAGYMAGSDQFQTLIGEVAALPIRSVLFSLDMVAESIYTKISIKAAQILLDLTGNTSWSDEVKKVLAGEIVDSIYAKGIGEILSKPATEVTLTILDEEYKQIMKDRFFRGIKTEPGRTAPLVGFTTTLNLSMAISYDPLTNMVTGILSAKECSEKYAFFFMFDTGDIKENGKVVPASAIWDGRVHFINLLTGEEIR